MRSGWPPPSPPPRVQQMWVDTVCYEGKPRDQCDECGGVFPRAVLVESLCPSCREEHRLRALVAQLLTVCKAVFAERLWCEVGDAGYCRLCGAYVYPGCDEHFRGCPVPLLSAAIAAAEDTP